MRVKSTSVGTCNRRVHLASTDKAGLLFIRPSVDHGRLQPAFEIGQS